MRQDEPSQKSRLRDLFAPHPDPYRDFDRVASRKWGGALFLLQSALIAGLSPLTPPTDHVGDAGWAILAGVVALQLACAWLLLRRPQWVGDNLLLVLAYLAVATIAGLDYLADKEGAAYLPVFLLWVVYVPLANPPRRVVPFLLFVYAAAASSLLYTGWDHDEAVELFASLAVWLVLGSVAMLRSEETRRERSGLTRSGESAMRMAVTDSLTGLANRRAFDEIADRELARAQRSGAPLTLVFADLDGFKEVNDKHGHVLGDDYLRRVAETLQTMLRTGDMGFRWGGDEFALLLPDTDLAAAEPVCARLGGVVAATLEETAGVRLTLSFGIAQFDEDMTVKDLVSAADSALMRGKGKSPAAG
jgi:diguanylate cyclase (GGDEF)-like protein